MTANLQPSRFKKGLMTLTGTTDNGSTNILELNNSGGTIVAFINTSGLISGLTAGGGGTITGGTNGLSTSGANITLGGALTADTAITGAYSITLDGDLIVSGSTTSTDFILGSDERLKICIEPIQITPI